MIQVNRIPSPTMKLYTPDNKLLGIINEYELLDIRVQIKKAKVFGYYIIFNNIKVRMDKNGSLEDYPDGLFDTMSGYFIQLL